MACTSCFCSRRQVLTPCFYVIYFAEPRISGLVRAGGPGSPVPPLWGHCPHSAQPAFPGHRGALPRRRAAVPAGLPHPRQACPGERAPGCLRKCFYSDRSTSRPKTAQIEGSFQSLILIILSPCSLPAPGNRWRSAIFTHELFPLRARSRRLRKFSWVTKHEHILCGIRFFGMHDV